MAAEDLKKEAQLFRAAAGVYADTANRERLFVERVEARIARESAEWLAVARREEPSKTQPAAR